MKINVKWLARKLGPLVWASLALGVLLAILVNAANIRQIAIQHSGEFSVGDVLMKDSGDLAAMPDTLYGQTLREPVISSAWGSVIQTASLVTVVHSWQSYLALVLMGAFLSVVARDRTAKSTTRPTGGQMAHWPKWLHGPTGHTGHTA